MRLLVLATLPLVAGVAVTGPALLTLAYGEDYADAGTVLLVMLAPVVLQPMLRVSEGILYALARVRFIVITGLFATAVDLALAFLLIPSMDAVGAAIANGVAILVAGIPALALAVHLHRPAALPVGPLLRSIVVSLAVAGASWAALSLGTLVAVAAGALAFFVTAFLLRPLSSEDAEWLSGALGRGGARGVAAGFVRRIGAE
jgi:O-antigen/teichoic acid export membrane protein